MERVTRELQEVKRKYYEQKRREALAKARHDVARHRITSHAAMAWHAISSHARNVLTCKRLARHDFRTATYLGSLSHIHTHVRTHVLTYCLRSATACSRPSASS